MSIIDTLITDRTQSDVTRASALNAKGWLAMSAAERAEWLSGLKGSYNAADLNRVGQAVQYIAQRFYDYGYITDVQGVKTDWQASDIPTVEQMQTYIDNVSALRGTISMMDTTPLTPQSMEALDYIKANNIEKILQDIDTLLNRMAQAWFYSGDLYAGEREA